MLLSDYCSVAVALGAIAPSAHQVPKGALLVFERERRGARVESRAQSRGTSSGLATIRCVSMASRLPPLSRSPFIRVLRGRCIMGRPGCASGCETGAQARMVPSITLVFEALESLNVLLDPWALLWHPWTLVILGHSCTLWCPTLHRPLVLNYLQTFTIFCKRSMCNRILIFVR